jgi:hypothetical protein
VHQLSRFLAQRLQLARQAAALRLILHDKPAVPGSSAVVGEAGKAKVSGRRSLSFCRVTAAKRPNYRSGASRLCKAAPDARQRCSRRIMSGRSAHKFDNTYTYCIVVPRHFSNANTRCETICSYFA